MTFTSRHLCPNSRILQSNTGCGRLQYSNFGEIISELSTTEVHGTRVFCDVWRTWIREHCNPCLGSCSTWDIRPKRILNPNLAKSRLPITYILVTQSFFRFCTEHDSIPTVLSAKFWNDSTNAISRDLRLGWVAKVHIDHTHPCSIVETRISVTTHWLICNIYMLHYH